MGRIFVASFEYICFGAKILQILFFKGIKQTCQRDSVLVSAFAICVLPACADKTGRSRRERVGGVEKEQNSLITV